MLLASHRGVMFALSAQCSLRDFCSQRMNATATQLGDVPHIGATRGDGRNSSGLSCDYGVRKTDVAVESRGCRFFFLSNSAISRSPKKYSYQCRCPQFIPPKLRPIEGQRLESPHSHVVKWMNSPEISPDISNSQQKTLSSFLLAERVREESQAAPCHFLAPSSKVQKPFFR